MADLDMPVGRRGLSAGAKGGLAVVAGVLAGWYATNAGVIDWQQLVWSKPGREWALYAAGVAAVVTILGTLRMLGSVEPRYVAGAAVVAGAAAYALGLGAWAQEQTGSPVVCKRGYVVNLDATCEKAPAPAKVERG